jgi:hypothetical protein
MLKKKNTIIREKAKDTVIPVKEILMYVHDGIKVLVGIDYNAGTISILDQDMKPKKWLFNQREIEYMNGWRRILAAMNYSIDQAEAKLKEYQEQKLHETLKAYMGYHELDLKEQK